MSNMPQDNVLFGEVVIKMDSTLTFTHAYRGSPGLLLPMVGALSVVSDWFKNEIHKNQRENRNGLSSSDNGDSLEVEVSKDVAIDMYMNAMQKLRERVLAIDKSAPNSIFHVNPRLLETL